MERNNVFWKGEQEKVDKLQQEWYKDVGSKEKTVSFIFIGIPLSLFILFSLKTVRIKNGTYLITVKRLI